MYICQSFQLLFVVGTNVGDISLWEVGSRERLAHKPFKVWDISAASMPLQVLFVAILLEVNLDFELHFMILLVKVDNEG